MTRSTHCYIGTRSCGCVMDMVLDDESLRADLAERIAQMRGAGLTVTRIHTAIFRTLPAYQQCTHEPNTEGLIRAVEKWAAEIKSRGVS